MITTDTHVFFYSNTIYSNFHWTPGQFRYGEAELPFNSSEAAFMYAKARFFNDTETASRIVAAKSSFDAKRLGREVRGYVDKEWECVREGFMAHVLLAKFTQNVEWGKELKATGDRVLVEASPTDRIWGVGLSVEEAAQYVRERIGESLFVTGELCLESMAWPGRNLLGKALMTVRGLL